MVYWQKEKERERGGSICQALSGPKKGRHETSVWHPCLSRRDSALAALSYKSDLLRLTSDPFVFSVVDDAIYNRSMNSNHSLAIARENCKQKLSVRDPRGGKACACEQMAKKEPNLKVVTSWLVKMRWFHELRIVNIYIISLKNSINKKLNRVKLTYLQLEK